MWRVRRVSLCGAAVWWHAMIGKWLTGKDEAVMLLLGLASVLSSIPPELYEDVLFTSILPDCSIPAPEVNLISPAVPPLEFPA